MHACGTSSYVVVFPNEEMTVPAQATVTLPRSNDEDPDTALVVERFNKEPLSTVWIVDVASISKPKIQASAQGRQQDLKGTSRDPPDLKGPEPGSDGQSNGEISALL